MGMIILFWGLLCLPILMVSVWVFRRTAKKSRVLATGLASLILCISVLLWPIPMHGGFTVVAEVMYSEWRSLLRQRERESEERVDIAFNQKTSKRFTGPIDYEIERVLQHGWSEVLTEGGTRGWLSAATNLVWSTSLSVESNDTLPNLSLGKARCRQLLPTGKWALATEAEHALRWQLNGDAAMGKSPFSMLTYIVDDSMRMEIPTYAYKNANAKNQSGVRASFAVRCVAVTAEAPRGGYVKKDLSLKLWNAYQLSKLAP